jgi:hypothetical protein
MKYGGSQGVLIRFQEYYQILILSTVNRLDAICYK